MVDLQQQELPASLFDPSITVSYDKVSCMVGAYHAHLAFAYLVFATGVAAMATRLVWKRAHAWFGLCYIISMFWATGTSLVIHNTGLPPATLISFVWVLGGLCVGWVLIKLHEMRARRGALAALQAKLAASGGALPGGAMDLGAALDAELAAAAAGRGFWARLLSLKAAHGCLMFVSWINVAGRVFATAPDASYTCHTYPVLKPLDGPVGDAGAPLALKLVPQHDPGYARTPWAATGLVGWGVAMSLGPLAAAALVGAVGSFIGARRAAAARAAAAQAPQAADGASDVGVRKQAALAPVAAEAAAGAAALKHAGAV